MIGVYPPSAFDLRLKFILTLNSVRARMILFFVKKKTRRKDQVLLMRESMMHEAQYRTESNESWRMKIFVFKNIVSVYAQKQNVSC